MENGFSIIKLLAANIRINFIRIAIRRMVFIENDFKYSLRVFKVCFVLLRAKPDK